MPGRKATVLTGAQEADLRLAKAMAHPVRVKTLDLLREEGPLAPVDASDRLNVPLSNMSYHFRTLLELECIEEVEKKPVRGSIKTTYRSCVDLVFMRARWGGIDEKALDEMRRLILNSTAERLAEAIESKTFDLREEFRLTNQTVNLTESEWKEVTAKLEEAHQMLAVFAASPNDDSEPRFPATVSVQAYESPRLYER